VTVSVEGKDYPPVEFTLDPEHVAAFARAVGADPAAGVPPTYAAVYGLFATAGLLFQDPAAAVDFAHLLHSEQEFTWERHPEPGETVVATGRVSEDVVRRGLRFLTYDTGVTAAGEPIGTSRMFDVIRS